jgi:hypothetical protein
VAASVVVRAAAGFPLAAGEDKALGEILPGRDDTMTRRATSAQSPNRPKAMVIVV